MSVVLLSNNPRLGQANGPHHFDGHCLAAVRAGQYSRFILDAPPLAVLSAGLFLAYRGFRLHHHPLYGNIRPERQLFRSLIFIGEAQSRVHEWSLKLMEEAATLYRRVPALDRQSTPLAILEDSALLDYELLCGPLAEVGWPTDIELSFSHSPSKGGNFETGTAQNYGA